MPKHIKKTFEEVFEEYKLYAYSRHKKQGYETLVRNAKLHILPYFKNRNISDFKKIDIINWQNEIAKKNYSNSFNNTLYSTFSSIIKYCVICSYLDENIVLKVGNFKRKLEKKEHKVYNLWQFKKFRKNVKNIIIKQYFNFLYFYGTRPSEALALKFSDLNGKILDISHNLQRRGNREIDTPKNYSSIRKLELGIITRLRFWYLKCYYEKKYNDLDYDYFIFGGKKPLSTTTIDRYKKIAANKAGLYEITTHEFRHSYCSYNLSKRNANIAKVSKNMGHSKVSTTLDVYTHIMQEKRVTSTLLTRFKFFKSIGSGFKNLSRYIITRFFVE